MSSKFRDGFKRLALRMCCLSKKPVMRGQSTSSRMYYRCALPLSVLVQMA